MLDQGPVPVVVHGVFEYVVGALFIASPFLFGFNDSAAPTAAALVVGLLLLAFTATSALPTGLVRSVSLGVHVTVDLVLAVLLVALPFLLGFTDEAAPTALFIVVGVLHLLMTIATRFSPGDEADGSSDDGPSDTETSLA
jgi:hypothetical protein